MSCLENNKKKAESKLSDGLLLTNPQKQKYISSIAANDLNDFFELLQKFDVRVSVYKDASGKYTVTESSKDKLVNDLQISDDLERIYTIDTNKAFYSAEDKHKIASTATVDAILGSIPFVKEIPRIVDIKRQKYTYSEHLPITKARQLLYKIYVTNGIVPSSDVMAETILRKIDSDTLSNDDKRILLSIYNYVFSDVNLEYKDSLGKTTFLKSLKTISKTGPHPEIRDRARNYTSMFHTAITAINNFSYLMIITEDGNTVKAQDDTMLYRMSSVNAPQVNNLFEVLEIIDETQKERELIDVQLKQSVIDSFRDNNIGIVNQLVDGKVVTAAKFTHTDANTGKKLDIVIPFNLSTNKSDIVSIGNL